MDETKRGDLMLEGSKPGEIRLRSGILFNPLNPDPAKITIGDIAYGLAGQYRFAGHSRYTVAQHSVLGSELLGNGEDALRFLLHDSDEGLGLPDLARPIKHSSGFSFYVEAGEVLQAAVAKRFNLTYLISPQIKFTDDTMLRTEQLQLFGRKVKPGEIVFPIKIRVWSPEEAEEQFLLRFHLLTSSQTFTTGEYAKSIGLGRHAALLRLTKLEKRGIVERVKVRQNQGGIVRPNVLGWRFLGEDRTDEVVSGRREDSGSEEEKTLVDSDSTGYSGG